MGTKITPQKIYYLTCIKHISIKHTQSKQMQTNGNLRATRYESWTWMPPPPGNLH